MILHPHQSPFKLVDSARNKKLSAPWMGSLLLHAAVIVGAYILSLLFKPSLSRETVAVEIFLDSQSSKKADSITVTHQKTIVQNTDFNRQKSKDAHYYSEHDHQSQRQQVREGSSLHAQKAGSKVAQKSAENPAQEKPESQKKQALQGLEKLALPIPGLSDLTPSATRHNQPHTASHLASESGDLTDQVAGEYVKGVEAGSETLLNTREYVFFTYFKRVKERLDQAWNMSLHAQLERYFRRGRQLASEHEYVTQLFVTLNHDGGVERLQILTPSGTKDLDEAAVKAFDKAGPFPNPPRGLLNQNRQFVLRWEFILRT